MSDNKEECKKCVFYWTDYSIQADGAYNTACRRFPPTGFPAMNKEGQKGVVQIFSPTKSDGWCGEFKVKLSIAS